MTITPKALKLEIAALTLALAAWQVPPAVAQADHNSYDYTGLWVIAQQKLPSDNLSDLVFSRDKSFPRIEFSRRPVYRVAPVADDSDPEAVAFRIYSAEGSSTEFVWSATTRPKGAQGPGVYVQKRRHIRRVEDPLLVLETKNPDHWPDQPSDPAHWPCGSLHACPVNVYTRCNARIDELARYDLDRYLENSGRYEMYDGDRLRNLYRHYRDIHAGLAERSCKNAAPPPDRDPMTARLATQPVFMRVSTAAGPARVFPLRVAQATDTVPTGIRQYIVPVDEETFRWHSVIPEPGTGRVTSTELLFERVAAPQSMQEAVEATGRKGWGQLFGDQAPRPADVFMGYDLRSLDPLNVTPGTNATVNRDNPNQSFSGALVFRFPTNDSYFYKQSSIGAEAYSVPYGMQYRPVSEKVERSHTQTIDSAVEAHDAYTIGFGAKINALFVSENFKGSVSSDKRHRLSTSNTTSMSRTLLTSYTAVLDLTEARLSRAFRSSARELGEGELSADEFIDIFGTHYAAGIVYGGLCWMSSDISEKSELKAQRDKIELSVEIGGTYEGVGGGGSLSSSTDRSLQTENGLTLENVRSNAIGTCVEGGTAAPVALDLRPMHELVNPVLLPDKPAYRDARRKLRERIDQLNREGREALVSAGNSYPRFYDFAYGYIEKPGPTFTAGGQPSSDGRLRWRFDGRPVQLPKGFKILNQKVVDGAYAGYGKLNSGTLLVRGEANCKLEYDLAHPNFPNDYWRNVFNRLAMNEASHVYVVANRYKLPEPKLATQSEKEEDHRNFLERLADIVEDPLTEAVQTALSTLAPQPEYISSVYISEVAGGNVPGHMSAYDQCIGYLFD